MFGAKADANVLKSTRTEKYLFNGLQIQLHNLECHIFGIMLTAMNSGG